MAPNRHHRKICVVTATRAEYGLLNGIMRAIKADAGLALQIAVTGMHLSDEFGRTADAIRADGFDTDSEVHMLLSSDQPVAISKSMGLGMIGFSDVFARLRPDIVLLLGDRFETLAVAATAATMLIPIAHIHGGEISEGALDDSFRHAISKLSHLHFVATETFRRRLIQMGEAPERVLTVGAPGLDNLGDPDLPSRTMLAERIGLELSQKLFLITYHPATLGGTDAVAALEELFAALAQFPDAVLLFTSSNADSGGRAINERLKEFVARNPRNAALVTSLGQKYYLSALKEANAVIGNSSSGIIEAPALGTPTINLGSRQKGRSRSATVIDCKEHLAEIVAAIRQALDPAWLEKARKLEPAYGRPANTAARIVDHLRSVDLDGILVKPFHDVPVSPIP